MLNLLKPLPDHILFVLKTSNARPSIAASPSPQSFYPHHKVFSGFEQSESCGDGTDRKQTKLDRCRSF
jgi:hypothetical protein